MAIDPQVADIATPRTAQARLVSFHLEGLFGGADISLEFPGSGDDDGKAKILILSGQNGSGKTTVFNMLDGMLKLDFDPFRKVPFRLCRLLLSSGDTLSVRYVGDGRCPLEVSFGDLKVRLLKEKFGSSYKDSEEAAIRKFREVAFPAMRAVEYHFLPVSRSSGQGVVEDSRERAVRPGLEVKPPPSLSEKVAKFLKVAQIDHRRFFRSEEISLIPRLLDRMSGSIVTPSRDELLARVSSIKEKQVLMTRYGLYFDHDLLNVVEGKIQEEHDLVGNQLVLLETYVEMQEAMQVANDMLIARLQEFDKIMSDFLVGKAIRIDAEKGLSIESHAGGALRERDLSSGEYHFLYMMVSALLCQRIGSVIAIDEPELSLHVSWQRKLVSALARCASGASPLFLFATHSVAISAEHADQVVKLSAVD